VDTLRPVMKRGRNYWDKTHMPVVEFRERVAKIRREMKKEDISVLLLYGQGVDDYGNISYISNHVMDMASGAMVMVPQKGEVALIIEGAARELQAVKNTTWLTELVPCADVSKGGVQYLREKGLPTSTMAFVGLRESMPHEQWQFIQESTNQCKTIDGGHIIRKLRMVKSPREYAQIRQASRIVSKVFKAIASTDYPDMSERTIEAVAERRAFLEGVEDFRMLLARGDVDRQAFRPAESRLVSPGGNLIVYLAVEYERYWSEGIRTFIAQSPRLVETESPNSHVLFTQIVSKIRVGKPVAWLYCEAASALRRSKIGFITEYGLGEGIGLSRKEPPAIAESEATKLKAGMCFALRLATRDSAGTVVVGHTVGLSKSGPEVLTG
jgi:Xaa-Pro aminopeptidase